MKRQVFRSAALPLVGLLLCPSITHSAIYTNGTATATMPVTLRIQSGCTIVATPLDFGTQSVLNTLVPGTSTLTVTCTPLTAYNIGLNAGLVVGSVEGARLMQNTTSGNTGTVLFNLYKEAAYTNIWGNTQDTTTLPGNVGTGSPQDYTVYGQVPAQSPAPALGTYKATITATVYY